MYRLETHSHHLHGDEGAVTQTMLPRLFLYLDLEASYGMQQDYGHGRCDKNISCYYIAAILQ
jgi:hypothetical protein